MVQKIGQVTMTVAGQSAVYYTFDTDGRLTQITQNGNSVAFSYDSASRRTSLTLPNGVVVGYGYDHASELTSIQYQLGSAVLGNLGYTYDLDGRRTAVTGSFARTNLPNPITGAQYNANNQLMQWGSASPTYDNNGNLQSDGTNSYSWNSRNQLASMNNGTDVFTYDSFGRRIAKSIAGTGKSFLYDETNVVQELQGTNPTASLLTGGIDEIFLRVDSSGTWNLLADALGSTLALSDNSGTIQTQYAYEPFGNTTTTGASSANVTKYTGRELDETGLYFYRARYYSPQIGRFISEDPIGFRGGINLYRYVTDSPTNFIDPFGLGNCTRTPLGLICYPDSNPGWNQFNPSSPGDLPPVGDPPAGGGPRQPTSMPNTFCEPGTDCHDTMQGGLPMPTYGDFVPNPCQGWDFDSSGPLPYNGPSFSCSGKRNPCLDAEQKFVDACHRAGCVGRTYNGGLNGAVSAACCQKQ